MIEVSKKKSAQISVEQELAMFTFIFDSIYSGSMVTDAEGYITHFNKLYGEFLGLKPEEQIGKHCTEVIENTRMHIVAKTGKPEINVKQRINGRDMVVQRIPIKKDGDVIGVFGQVTFEDVKDVKRLAEKLSLFENKVEFYEKQLMALRSTKFTMNSLIGISNAFTSLKNEAQKAAATKYPVLITGETGTGKELFAHAIHDSSKRRLQPFIKINCAAIPKDLLESELFGYDRGAFTGANTSGKPGKFELAHKGTIFLDEIGDLPMEIQPKLLRVLEEKEIEGIGGTSRIKVDFRLITATNQNIEDMLRNGQFRKDLFYRISVIPINIPPLRERREDIIYLTHSLLQNIAQDLGVLGIKIDLKAEEALKNYDWPGNVRELSNVLERVSSSLNGDTIHLCDLPFYFYNRHKTSKSPGHSSLKDVQKKAEKEAILYALESTNYNKVHTAKILGIHRTLLYKKMKKHDIHVATNTKPKL